METNKETDRLSSLARLNLNAAEEAKEAGDYNSAAKTVGNCAECVRRGGEMPVNGEARIKAIHKFLMWNI